MAPVIDIVTSRNFISEQITDIMGLVYLYYIIIFLQYLFLIVNNFNIINHAPIIFFVSITIIAPPVPKVKN